MRHIHYFIILSILFTSCNNHKTEIERLKSEVAELQKQIATSYKPGFGDLMMNIQSHHTKLWFAGSSNNWALAKFQLHEIEEAVEDIQLFHRLKPESEKIGILANAIDNVNAAIESHDLTKFKSGFNLLTNTCNACHKANNVGFNVIKTPELHGFDNQNFNPEVD